MHPESTPYHGLESKVLYVSESLESFQPHHSAKNPANLSVSSAAICSKRMVSLIRATDSDAGRSVIDIPNSGDDCVFYCQAMS